MPYIRCVAGLCEHCRVRDEGHAVAIPEDLGHRPHVPRHAQAVA